MYQRVGKSAFKKDLTNILALMDQLGNPHQRFSSIHIAGTNGKGSTTHLLGAILQKHGLKVGLYTSPHYRDFRERIKINGSLIPEKAVMDFVEQNQIKWRSIQPSFFEITVALAFHHFAKEKVDIAIVETGLGGRLDSTNILQPILSIITNISFDHQQFLGNTLELIAGEKAGIIKKETPIVIGETQEQTKPVFEKVALQKNAPIVFADQHIKAKVIDENFEYSTYDVYQQDQLMYATLEVNLFGNYQKYNLQTTLQAIELLKLHFSISTDLIYSALKHLKQLTNFLGRWQLLGLKPTIIADSAHNEKGLKLLNQQLAHLKNSKSKLHIVLGMVNDKDPQKLLSAFPKDASYYFAKANIPRGLDAEILRKKALDLHLIGNSYSSVTKALEAAQKIAQEEDIIFVGGSVFVVAEVL